MTRISNAHCYDDEAKNTLQIMDRIEKLQINLGIELINEQKMHQKYWATKMTSKNMVILKTMYR